jgi:hypothetical protein
VLAEKEAARAAASPCLRYLPPEFQCVGHKGGENEMGGSDAGEVLIHYQKRLQAVGNMEWG